MPNNDNFDWMKWSKADWEALARATEWMKKHAQPQPVWWSEQLQRPNQLLPAGGLLGTAPFEVKTPTEWDDGGTAWDGGQTTWDPDEVKAPVWPEEEYARSFRMLRTEAYSSPAWEQVEKELLERHRYECFGCNISDPDLAPRLAVAARPLWYSQNKDGTFDYTCNHLRYMLVPLCSVCCDAHDERFDGTGLPKDDGPYIR